MYLGEGLEETVDELFRLIAADVEALGQTEYRDTVDDAEVGAFRLRTLVASHLADVFLINGGSRGGMQVFALAEHLEHVLVAREMGHHTQFYLTVVC